MLTMNVNINSGNGVQRTYTAKEVAGILGVSSRTAYNLCETTKDFKVLRMGKRCLRIHKESFDQWFNSVSGTPP
jgi:excisionase family DNA binding protein